ncbi:vacuolar protein 8-like [Protopterus annectens]|uniref:vacuolar protein 8-like n=1 Tax=Protopterus annectens TaxID=7888 RepID=UPI001CFA379F|nr:vacuolar protein 8-like [Protopterus annectens]
MVTDDQVYAKECEKLQGTLKKRGYPESFVQNIVSEVSRKREKGRQESKSSYTLSPSGKNIFSLGGNWRLVKELKKAQIKTQDSNRPMLAQESAENLRTLAFSENPSLQQSAALYYLHLSQKLTTPLPADYLEPYHALLQSSDLEVQRMSSLSLVNLLVDENVNKELVVQLGLLEPMLELLESGDSVIQCNSCACVATLATSESNREAIISAEGIKTLLVLSKSYDPRIQQNAIGAILNLSRSEKARFVLHNEGAVPVLVLLLQSDDSEVQYYSSAALSNIATNPLHHQAMLQVGNGFLLKMLQSLMSSSVEKVSCQACVCLRNLAVDGKTQTELVAMNILCQVKSLLTSSSEAIAEAAVGLLCTLSVHPSNKHPIICEDLLESLALLLRSHRTKPAIVGHAASTIKNLSASDFVQDIIESSVVEGLFHILPYKDVPEECLVYVTACISELITHGQIKSHAVKQVDSCTIITLLNMARQQKNTEMAFQAVFIISHLGPNEHTWHLLKMHMGEVLGYILQFLKQQEIRFQHLGLFSLCAFSADAEFSLAVSQSPLADQLYKIRQQTEETQELLQRAMTQTAHMDHS